MHHHLSRGGREAGPRWQIGQLGLAKRPGAVGFDQIGDQVNRDEMGRRKERAKDLEQGSFHVEKCSLTLRFWFACGDTRQQPKRQGARSSCRNSMKMSPSAG